MRLALIFLLLAISRNVSSLRILEPEDGSELDGPKVRFKVEAIAQSEEEMVCLQLTNKRLTYESYTHCVANGTNERVLDGFGPGVWRCRAYTRKRAENESIVIGYAFRGAASKTTDSAESWFLVDRAQWENELFQDPAPRAVALLANIAARKKELTASVQEAAGRNSFVLISMANAGHVKLALNMIYSVRRTASDLGALIFALSQSAYESLRKDSGVHAILLTNTSHSAAPVPVQSRGFAAVAIVKPISILVVLQSGYDALWIDTDVVFFQTPKLLVHEASLQNKSIILQSGSNGPFDIARGESHFHVEACTGVFLARAESAALFEAAAQDLERISNRGDHRVGDQAAINLALFESRFRFHEHISFGLLDPLKYPAGGIFFETNLSSPNAVLAHNNFIIGHELKLRRFRERGLWFSEHHNTGRYLIHTPPISICSLNQVHIDHSMPLSIRSLHEVSEKTTPPPLNTTFLWAMDPALCMRSRYAVLTVSIGERPWAALLLGRFADYCKRISADLLGLRRVPKAPRADEYVNLDTLAKRAKLVLAAEALSLYERVLLLDDTIVVRADAPSLFDIVPPLAIGATVEDERIRPQSESEALLKLTALRHNASYRTDQPCWFNTGVLLLSWLHLPLLTRPPLDLDRLLFWDQGFLNAQVTAFRVKIYDLGYRYNFVGSFFSTNARKAPFPASAAFFIHGTTGLLMDLRGRTQFFENVSRTWKALGL